MPRYGMVIDVTKCNGCYNCFIACKDEYCGIGHPPYSAAQPMTGQAWMQIRHKERGQFPKVKADYIAVPCMHCENPLCVEMARDGAIYKREDGIVLIDPKKAAGRKELVSSCPYRVIYWNEAENLPQKCTLCAHLLDAGWKEPRCVEACPTGTLVFGDLDDPNSEVSKLLASAAVEVVHREYGLAEKVRYIGLPKSFVAGSVVLGDTDECAVEATVTLEGSGTTSSVQTDGFGDFEFEGLPANTAFKVIVSAPGYTKVELETKTTASIYLGDIVLKKLG